MLYRRLADLLVLLHAAIGTFFLFGGGLVMYDLRVGWLHAPLVLWVCSALLANWTCPLTPLEVRLRQAAGERGYEGSFIDQHVMPVCAPPKAPDSPVQLGRKQESCLGLLFLAINAALYAAAWRIHMD